MFKYNRIIVKKKFYNSSNPKRVRLWNGAKLADINRLAAQGFNREDLINACNYKLPEEVEATKTPAVVSLYALKYKQMKEQTRINNKLKNKSADAAKAYAELLGMKGEPYGWGATSFKSLKTLCGSVPGQSIEVGELNQKGKWDNPYDITHNRKYSHRVVEGVTELDINSAFPAAMYNNDLPGELLKYIECVKLPLNEPLFNNSIKLYKYGGGSLSFKYTPLESLEGVYMFKPIRYGQKFIEYWTKIKTEATQNKDQIRRYIAKQMLNSAIGAIKSFANSVLSRYVWFLVKEQTQRLKNAIEEAGGVWLKTYIDSLTFIPDAEGKALSVCDIGQGLGQFKVEAKNKKIWYHRAGFYQIEGGKPKTAGFGWDIGNGTICVNGEWRNENDFKFINSGDVITCYEGGELIQKVV